MENLELPHEIVDALPFAALVTDPSGGIVWWNKTAEHIFGWKSSEVFGRPSPIVPRNRQDEYRAFREIVLNGRMLRAESLQQRKDGALIEVKLTMVPLRNRSGAIKHILILHEPVSEPVFLVTKRARLSAPDAQPSADEQISEPSPATLSRFTPRQREIVILVAHGCTNREIAKSLSLGEQQIKNYLRGIYRETRVSNRADLLVWLNTQG